MEFLYTLEKIRFPFLNELMLLITHLGEETAFLVVALIVFWCVDKYQGYYVLGVGLFGNMANQFMKILCRIPRPWVRDPNFKPLEDAIAEAKRKAEEEAARLAAELEAQRKLEEEAAAREAARVALEEAAAQEAAQDTAFKKKMMTALWSVSVGLVIVAIPLAKIGRKKS